MSFRAASKEAIKSPFKQHKLGAVIVKGHRILASGYNSLRPSRLLETPHLHAEAAAILKLLKERRLHDLCGSSIYVMRYTKGGRIGMARPCKNCYNLLQALGVRDMYYTNDIGTTSYEKL